LGPAVIQALVREYAELEIIHPAFVDTNIELWKYLKFVPGSDHPETIECEFPKCPYTSSCKAVTSDFRKCEACECFRGHAKCYLAYLQATLEHHAGAENSNYKPFDLAMVTPTHSCWQCMPWALGVIIPPTVEPNDHTSGVSPSPRGVIIPPTVELNDHTSGVSPSPRAVWHEPSITTSVSPGSTMIQVLAAISADDSNTDCGVRMLMFVDFEERCLVPTLRLHDLEIDGPRSRRIITAQLLAQGVGGWPKESAEHHIALPSIHSAWEEVKDGELDLRPLKPFQDGRASWINGDIINAYLMLRRNLVPHCIVLLGSYFMTQLLNLKAEIDEGASTWSKSRIREWFNKSRPEQARESAVTCVYIPVNFEQAHWGIIRFDFDSLKVTIYDGTTLPAKEIFAKYVTHVAVAAECLSILLREKTYCTSRDNDDDVAMLHKVRRIAHEHMLHAHEQCDPQFNGLHPMAAHVSVTAHKQEESSFTTQELDAHLLPAGTYDAMSEQVLPAAKQMRTRVAEEVLNRCKTDHDFAHLVAERYRMREPTHDYSDALATAMYNAGIKHGDQGGEVELEELSRILNRPLILFEHPVKGTFSARTHIGKDRPGAPVFLLLTRLGKADGLQHWQVLVPAGSDTQYVNELDAAMSLVKVHPRRLVLRLGPDLIPFFVFAMPGDGHCLYTSAAFAGLIINKDFQPGGCHYLEEWLRLLPPIPDHAIQITMEHKACWNATNAVRSIANAGDNTHAFGNTNVFPAVRLSAFRRDVGAGTHLPDSVLLDTGAGHGGLLWANSILGGEAPTIGFEMCRSTYEGLYDVQECLQDDPRLHDVRRNHVCARRQATQDVTTLEGVTHAVMWDGIGRVDTYDQQHQELMKLTLTSTSMRYLETTKMTRALEKVYAENDTRIADALTNFQVVTITQVPRSFGLRTTVRAYVRKNVVRGDSAKEEQDVPVPDMDPTIVNMIACCRFKDPQAPLQVMVHARREDIAKYAKTYTDQQETVFQVILGACFVDSLQATYYEPGDTCRTGDVTGVMLGTALAIETIKPRIVLSVDNGRGLFRVQIVKSRDIIEVVNRNKQPWYITTEKDTADEVKNRPAFYDLPTSCLTCSTQTPPKG